MHEPTSTGKQNEMYSYRVYEDLYDFSSLKYPVSLKQIKKFEEVNNISLNVYGISTQDDEEEICRELLEELQCSSDDGSESGEESDDSGNSESIEVVRKRKANDESSDEPSPKRRRNIFIDDEVGVSYIDDGESDIDDQDLIDLIDDAEIEENDEDFYRVFDQERGAFSASPVRPPPVPAVSEKRGTIIPLRVADDVIENRHVNLLLTEGENNSHYSTIKSFSRLVRSQVTRRQCQHFFCYRCLHGFIRQDLLDNHIKLCKNVAAQRIKMPTKKESKLKFTNIQKQLRAPFVVYADFECLLKDMDVETSPIGIEEAAEDNKSRTVKYQEHVPCSYAYKIISDVPEYQPELKHELCEDAASKFLTEMQQVANHIVTEYLLKQKPKPRLNQLSAEERQRHLTSDCHICGESFRRGHNIPLSERRVLDHDHLVSEPGKEYGKYRGPAHNHCNLQYKIDPKTYKLPICMHNFQGYDSHILVKALEKEHGNVKVIPNNMERYMSMSIGQLRFIDSMQFMNSSLEKLVETLDGSELKITKEQFPDPQKFDLVKQKGVYPYEYFTSFARFEDTNLPPPEDFKNSLTGEDISEEKYQLAKDIWNAFGCINMQDYHDVYLQTDVLLLADVFEKFRDTCSKNYDLDPAHYLSAPGLAWDAALKMTKVELELFTDLDMYLFMENSMRGGVSMISNRYAKANNPYVEDFDSSKPLVYLQYLDANNLYGWGMYQNLPIRNFRWFTVDQIQDHLPISSFRERFSTLSNSPKGYILKVDLKYPANLHDDHSDLPLAPQHFKITPEMYSPFMTNHFPITTTSKLTPNLNDKLEYTLHYRNLQLYLDLGMEVTKIHQVLEFDELPWLRPYIEFNTECRAAASSEFEKDFYKLMVNAVFGKTMENLRKRVNIELVMSEDIFKKRVAKPTFKRGQIIREDLMAVQCLQGFVTLNRPIYAGFSILELSKTLMYDFHYRHMKQEYPGDRIKLLFTDTDSLCYAIKTKDIYEDMEKHAIEKYDFSGYPKEHALYSIINKKAIGYFKDELNSIPMGEFAGLRSKCYSTKYKGEVKNNVIVDHDEHEKNAAAGVKKSVKKRSLRHAHYLKTLNGFKSHVVTQNTILSKKHQLHTVNQRRVGLSVVDTKRYILNNGHDTLAHGHWRIAAGQAEFV